MSNLIKRFERKIATDTSYLIKGGSLLGASQIISTIATLALLVAMGHILSPETFGKYTYVLSTGALLGAISLTGLATTVVQAVSRGQEDLLSSAYKVILKWSLLSLIISFTLSAYYYTSNNNELAISFLITGILNPLIASNSLYISYLTGMKDFKRLALIKTSTSVIATFILLGTVFFTHELYLLVLFNLLPTCILSYIAYKWICRNRNKKERHEVNGGMISYAKHLSVMNAFAVASTTLDKIIVFHFLGPLQLAIYTFAIAPVQKLRTPDQIIASLALPKLATSNFRDLQKTLVRKVYIMSVFLTPITIGYIFISPYIYSLLLPNYIDSIKYSQVFSLTIIVTSSILITQALTAHSRKKELYIVKTTIPIVRIFLFFILIPFYQIWGIIFALIIAQVINFFLLLFLFKKAH